MKPAALSLLTLVAATTAIQAGAPLTAGTPIPLTGTKGGFDFLEIDAPKRRFLADHTANGTLDVIDLETGKLTKSVPTGGAQGVTVDEKGGRYLVSVGKEKKCVIVDRETLAVTGEIPLGGEGDSISWNAKSGRAYIGHDDGKEFWVVDPASKAITATIEIPEGPEYTLGDATGDRVFLNIKSNDTVLVIDPVKSTIASTWTTKPAVKPHGLAFEAKTNRLFAAGVNGQLAIIDAATGKNLGSVKIAPNIDQIAFDAEWRRIYCASRDGIMTTVQVTDAGAESLGDVKTAKGAKTVAVDSQSHAVWTAYAEGTAAFVLKLTAVK